MYIHNDNNYIINHVKKLNSSECVKSIPVHSVCTHLSIGFMPSMAEDLAPP